MALAELSDGRGRTFYVRPSQVALLAYDEIDFGFPELFIETINGTRISLGSKPRHSEVLYTLTCAAEDEDDI